MSVRPVTPEGAIDCHMHVFADPADYPPAPTRGYTPHPATIEQFQSMIQAVGLERTVFVQPSAYAADNRLMLDVMKNCPIPCRGVAVINGETSDQALQEMAALGVVGVRLNLESTPHDRTASDLLEETAARVAPLGWHVQIFANLETIVGALPTIRATPLDIVVDHMGLAMAEKGADQLGFDNLLGAVEDGACWVKLSGAYRVAHDAPDFKASIPIAKRFVAANPDRLVWGSDWPHLGFHKHQKSEEDIPRAEYRPLECGRLLQTLWESCGSSEVYLKVLVDNPARLYRFAGR